MSRAAILLALLCAGCCKEHTAAQPRAKPQPGIYQDEESGCDYVNDEDLRTELKPLACNEVKP